MQIFRQWAKIFGLFGVGVALLIFILAYSLAGQIYEYDDTVGSSELPPVDAIVCLAGGRGRIVAAGDLWFRYWEEAQDLKSDPRNLPVLYFSGIDPAVNWINLSKLLHKNVAEILTPQNIFLEKESNNTDENAQFLARYAEQKHWRRILLLTSSYHMKRAAFIFESVLNRAHDPVQVETHTVYQDPFDVLSWRVEWNGIRVTIFEYFKWIYYKLFWTPQNLSDPYL